MPCGSGVIFQTAAGKSEALNLKAVDGTGSYKNKITFATSCYPSELSLCMFFKSLFTHDDKKRKALL